MKLVLPLRNQQVELPLLWRMVAILGGSGEVTRGSQWPIVAEKLLNVSPNNTVSFAVFPISQARSLLRDPMHRIPSILRICV